SCWGPGSGAAGWGRSWDSRAPMTCSAVTANSAGGIANGRRHDRDSRLWHHRPLRGGDMRLTMAILLGTVLTVSLLVTGRAQTGPVVSGAHRFEKVADGVYYATASGTMNVGANSPIFVNEREAIVIDS